MSDKRIPSSLVDLMWILDFPTPQNAVDRFGRLYPVGKHVLNMGVVDAFVDKHPNSNIMNQELSYNLERQFSHDFNVQVMALGEQCRYEVGVDTHHLRHLRMQKWAGYRDLKMIIPQHRLHDLTVQFDSLPPTRPDKPDGYVGSFLDIEIYMVTGIETGLLYSAHDLWLYVRDWYRVNYRRDEAQQMTTWTAAAAYAMGLDNAQTWARVK